MKNQARKNSLMPNGIPKYIRCYDNLGETFDRFTVVFTGNYKKQFHEFHYIGMSSNPFHPQGFGQHGETVGMPVDKPTYSHLGRKIKFADLPKDCKDAVISDYISIWDINL